VDGKRPGGDRALKVSLGVADVGGRRSGGADLAQTHLGSAQAPDRVGVGLRNQGHSVGQRAVEVEHDRIEAARSLTAANAPADRLEEEAVLTAIADLGAVVSNRGPVG
jgi:hypothetical protein